MKFIISMMLAAMLISVVGCSSSSQYLVDKPFVIYPQNVLHAEGDAVQEKSMQALLNSFADHRWDIHGVDKENSTIIAEVCRRGEYCAEVMATVQKNGSVEFIRTPGQKITDDGAILLQRWLQNIKKRHARHMRQLRKT